MNDNVTFSKQLQRRYAGLRFRKHHLRLLAVALTLGEVYVGWVLFKHADWLGAYAMGAYLAKEHVIARVVGE